MAMTISKEIYVKSVGGLSEIIAEINVDTSNELPKFDNISGRILHQGSTALIINEGKLAVLSGDGKWYGVSGEIVKE